MGNFSLKFVCDGNQSQRLEPANAQLGKLETFALRIIAARLPD